MARRLDVALDVGSRFCDLVAVATDAPPIVLKRPATSLPLDALLRAMLDEAGIAPTEVARLRLATTLATNALVTGTAAPVTLVATRGFTDVPDLGRQSRRDPEDSFPPPPTPPWLSPPESRIALGGRIGADGLEAEPVPAADLAAALDRLRGLPPGAPVAICLLFAPLNPAHELALSAAIAAIRPDLRVSLSHQVDPAPREFERMLATLADAALKPLAGDSLAGLQPVPWVLRATGGVAPLEEALAHPLGLAMSGPAAGGRAVAHWAAGGDAIGLDMGGTTTEVSLVRAGAPLIAREVGLGTLRLRCPALDVESIACGAGTRIALDGGRLVLLPPAEPACCGGDVATVMDAALVAGWLPTVISGVALDVAAARAVLLQALGSADGMPALMLVEATIAERLRRIALRRGLDPTRALLVAGGGAGPLHAAAIAARIGARRVLVPPAPGLLAAYGLALAPASVDATQPCDLPLDDVASLAACAAAQAAGLAARLARWGLNATAHHSLAVSYAGQAEPLDIAFAPGEAAVLLAARFDAAHAAARGHAAGGARRIVALRSWAEAPLAAPAPAPPCGSAAPRPDALPRNRLVTPRAGPLLVDAPDATIRIPAGWTASPRGDGALLLERR